MESISNSIKLNNCCSIESMKTMRDNHFDWAIVDPEYGIGESSKNHKSRNTPIKQQNGKFLSAPKVDYIPKEWDNKPPPKEYFEQLFRVSKNQIIWGINYFTSIYDLRIGSGRLFWDKVNGNNDFSDGEIAFVSTISSTRLIRYMWNGMMQGKSINEGHIQQGNKHLNEKRIQVAQKPVILYKWLLSTFLKEGETILDTHHGSGSLSIACHDLGFHIEAFEKDIDNFTAAKNRIKKHVFETLSFDKIR